MDSGAEKTLTFTWDTSDLDADDYTIRAVASTVTGETDTTNNIRVYGTFTLSAPSPAWPTTEIIIAGVEAAIIIVAIGAYFILRRRTKSV